MHTVCKQADLSPKNVFKWSCELVKTSEFAKVIEFNYSSII